MTVGDYSNNMDRNDYDINASQDVQAAIHSLAAQLEAVLDQQEADVKRLMSNYHIDGVSGTFQGLEDEWNKAGFQVRAIIQGVKAALGTNDEIARTALTRATAAVGGD